MMMIAALLGALPAAKSITWTFSSRMQVPKQPNGSVIPYAHALEVDSQDRLYLTYWDWNTERRACLVRWDPDEKGVFQGPKVVGNGKELPMCAGGTGSYSTDSVHGIRIVEEPCNDKSGQCEYMYHANNNQGLFKTNLDGEVIWFHYGEPGHETQNVTKPSRSFTPTWFDKQPGSEYLYLADGYGSSKVYVYNKDGTYLDIVFDGTEDGGKRFTTPHAISWDPRVEKMVVSDRSNHRLVYYDVDKNDPNKFQLSSEMQVKGSPCNVRFWTSPGGEKFAVVPVLEGLVYVYDGSNALVHTINVTADMGLRFGFDDPHDAVFTRRGDIVVGTYHDGYVGLWKFGADLFV
eukprot:TRINITY_DN20159_c0_g1_i1.p1 TRINITY_DN20159_c0_g1~~TRINITY_DN20159_c0_g1_i1.p1  ORF type:complete len:347 (+),score=51.23 TRINITY_DN20159_c0_g1_i1:72-1112(+)